MRQNPGLQQLVGTTTQERRGVAEVDTTYVDPSALDVHNENSKMMSGISVPLLLDVVYIMSCMCGDISC